MRKSAIILSVLFAMITSFMCVSCNGNIDALVCDKSNGEPEPVSVTYTVTFITNGGTAVESQTVKAGECVLRSAVNSTKEGYDLENWYSDEALSVVFDFNTAVTGDITLYAKWTPAPLRFIAEEVSIVQVNKRSGAPDISLVWRKKGDSSWTDYVDGYLINLDSGDEVEMRAKTTNGAFTVFPEGDDRSYSNRFAISGKVAVRGNLMYLLDSTGESLTVPSYAFSGLFAECEITEAPALPATTIADSCYEGMFYGCSELKKAPALPATIVKKDCYSNMFAECTSLTEAPELPATVMAEGCYGCMFENCTSLTEAPELPATVVAEECYYRMFKDCTSLTKTPSELPATVLAKQCYRGMFDGCESLTQVPSVLPATTLAEKCYTSMFDSCESLETAPEIMATSLNGCYECLCYTFSGCEKLKYIKYHFCYTDNIQQSYTLGCFEGVSPTGEAHIPQEAIDYGKVHFSWVIDENSVLSGGTIPDGTVPNGWKVFAL